MDQQFYYALRHHFRHPQAMFNKGSLFYSHCETSHLSSCIARKTDFYDKFELNQRAHFPVKNLHNPIFSSDLSIKTGENSEKINGKIVNFTNLLKTIKSRSFGVNWKLKKKVTKSHKMSQNVTKCHKLSQNVTKVTKRHKKSQNVTKSPKNYNSPISQLFPIFSKL
jgi:hypothetical protein